MPSTYSVSKRRPRPSSTVITPSLPTFSITSAIISPISGSAAEMAATWAICSFWLTGLAWSRTAARTARTPLSRPRFRLRRASSSKTSCLAIGVFSEQGCGVSGVGCRGTSSHTPHPTPHTRALLLNLGQDVLLGENQVLFLVELDLVAGVLGVD